MKYVRELQFEEKPEYAYLKSLIAKMYDRHNYEFDMQLDWLLLNDGQTLKQKKKKEEQKQQQQQQQEEDCKNNYRANNNNNEDENKQCNNNNNNHYHHMILDDDYGIDGNNNDDNNYSPMLNDLIKKTEDTNDLITDYAKY